MLYELRTPPPCVRSFFAPAVADGRAKAFQALTGMGFREGEAKRALARIPHPVSSLEQLIRQALRELASQ